MDELFSEMQKKGMLAFEPTCGLPEFLKSMCDADARHDKKLNNSITIELINTIPLGIVETEFTDLTHATDFEVENLPESFGGKIIDRRN